jgi:hypothetical protein
MERTYSQKVARVFELICYVLLIPAIISLIYPAIAVFGGLLQGRAEVFFVGLIPFGIAGVGVILLIGYHKLAENELDENLFSTLWIATAIYNFLLLLPWLLAASAYLQSPEKLTDDGNWIGFLILLSIISGYITAIYFSLKVYSLERFIRI